MTQEPGGQSFKGQTEIIKTNTGQELEETPRQWIWQLEGQRRPLRGRGGRGLERMSRWQGAGIA